MKYLKTYKLYEGFRDIYQIDPNEPVVIKDEFLDKLDSIKDEEELYKGKPGTMKYQKDEFFSYITFNTNHPPNKGYFKTRTISLPTYMLIHQDKYEVNKSIEKYNL